MPEYPLLSDIRKIALTSAADLALLGNYIGNPDYFSAVTRAPGLPSAQSLAMQGRVLGQIPGTPVNSYQNLLNIVDWANADLLARQRASQIASARQIARKPSVINRGLGGLTAAEQQMFSAAENVARKGGVATQTPGIVTRNISPYSKGVYKGMVPGYKQINKGLQIGVSMPSTTRAGRGALQQAEHGFFWNPNVAKTSKMGRLFGFFKKHPKMGVLGALGLIGGGLLLGKKLTGGGGGSGQASYAQGQQDMARSLGPLAAAMNAPQGAMGMPAYRRPPHGGFWSNLGGGRYG